MWSMIRLFVNLFNAVENATTALNQLAESVRNEDGTKVPLNGPKKAALPSAAGAKQLPPAEANGTGHATKRVKAAK